MLRLKTDQCTTVSIRACLQWHIIYDVVFRFHSFVLYYIVTITLMKSCLLMTYYQVTFRNNSISTDVLLILGRRILGEHRVSFFIRLRMKCNLLLSICQSLILNV
jgi:hypothetical protein